MDTSETYIKMRLAAISDLGMGKPPEAVDEDVITGQDTYHFQTESIFIDAKGNFYYSDETRACQLERQDQLQEMVNIQSVANLLLSDMFLGEMFDPPMRMRDDWSLEQLWLAFVMEEKYGKVWDFGKEDWIIDPGLI